MSNQLENLDPKYIAFLTSLLSVKTNQERYDAIREQEVSRYDKTIEEVEKDFIQLVENALRIKIRELNALPPSLEQKMVKSQILEWLKCFVMSPKDAEELINIYSVEETDSIVYTIKDALDLNKNNKTKFLIKELIAFGRLYVFAAPPKVGKSLMITSLALAIARGKPFLNRESTLGNVLYIQNEEQIETTTIERIYNHGLQHLELDSPELYKQLINSNRLLLSKNYDLVLDQDKILKLVKEKNIDLVIIDSLGASIRRSGLTEHSPELGSYLYSLQNKCQENNFTAIILHHATKADSKEDKTKMLFGIAGTNTILRANDGLIRLFSSKNKENEDVIALYTIPREGKPLSLTLKIEEDEANYWYYEVDKETSLSPHLIELQNDILTLLYEKYYEWVEDVGYNETSDIEELVPVYGLSLAEIMEITNQTRTVIVSRLNDMKSTEAITCTPSRKDDKKVFIYGIHHSGESWMKSYLDIENERRRKQQEEEEEKKRYSNQISLLAKELVEYIVEDKKEEVLAFKESLTKSEMIDVSKHLNSEHLNLLLLVFNPPDFNVGDKVRVIESNKIMKINNIVFVNNAKVGYHKYYLDNIIKPYLKEDITDENVRESTVE